jgi:hypothetical protein
MSPTSNHLEADARRNAGPAQSVVIAIDHGEKHTFDAKPPLGVREP